MLHNKVKCGVAEIQNGNGLDYPQVSRIRSNVIGIGEWVLC